MKKLFITLAALGLVSCSDNTGTTGTSLSGWDYSVVGNGESLTHGSELAGTGAVQFKAQMPGGDKNVVAFKFRLEDGGSVRYIANSKDGLTQGIEFLFSRNGNQLVAAVTASGEEEEITHEVENKLGAIDGDLFVKIETHNDEGDKAHIIVSNTSGELFEMHDHGHHDHADMSHFHAQPAEEHEHEHDHEEELHSPGKGEGRNFGFVIARAALKEITAAKAEHH